MNYDTIVAIENFIENLDNPRKQIIARELVVNPNYEIIEIEVFDRKDLFVRERKSNNHYKLSTFISSKCNC
jgi:hypothetical protein